MTVLFIGNVHSPAINELRAHFERKQFIPTLRSMPRLEYLYDEYAAALSEEKGIRDYVAFMEPDEVREFCRVVFEDHETAAGQFVVMSEESYDFYLREIKHYDDTDIKALFIIRSNSNGVDWLEDMNNPPILIDED